MRQASATAMATFFPGTFTLICWTTLASSWTLFSGGLAPVAQRYDASLDTSAFAGSAASACFLRSFDTNFRCFNRRLLFFRNGMGFWRPPAATAASSAADLRGHRAAPFLNRRGAVKLTSHLWRFGAMSSGRVPPRARRRLRCTLMFCC